MAHVETAYTMENIARTLPRLGRFAEAESLHWRTLEIRRRLLGPGNVTMARTLSPLAFLYAGRDESRRADSLMTEALRIFRAVLGDEHPETRIAVIAAGVMRTLVRDFAVAESLLTHAIDGWRRVRDPNDGLTLLAMGRRKPSSPMRAARSRMGSISRPPRQSWIQRQLRRSPRSRRQ